MTIETSAREAARVLRKPRFTAEALATRKGHDPRFLGRDLPALPLQRAGRGEKWLHYTHFSILMDKKKRLPRLTICDIDGRSWIELARAKVDVWSPDPRLALGEQPDETFYKKPDPKFNAAHNDFAFGHMVRRMDPNWSAAPDPEIADKEAKQAEIDTFHITNTAPQAERLNAGVWNDLEDIVLDEAKKKFRMKLVVLTGPVLGENDPLLHGTTPIPRQFWKLVAWRDGDRLAAAAWRQAQPASVLPREAAALPFDPRKSNIWLARVAEIAEQTGLDLDVYAAADTYDLRGATPVVGGRESARVAEIRTLAPRSAGELLMRAPDEPGLESLGLSPEEAISILEAQGEREREAPGAAPARRRGSAARETGPSAAALAARISARAFDMIVEHETGGRAFYEGYYKKRPVWPKAKSGVTIGCGYDLGYAAAPVFRSDWAALPAADRAALETCVGRHAGKDSGSTMERLLASVRHVRVEWETALAVFKAVSLPTFALKTYKALPNCDRLSGDCFGMLVSLTYNRGASYASTGDRYREMRAIRAAMESGRFSEIPAHIRAMKRIWVGTAVEAGLSRRREDEARMFERGLAAEPPVTAGAGGRETARVLSDDRTRSTALTGADEDFWIDLDEDDRLEMAATTRSAPSMAAQSVFWAPDREQPDYAHLELSDGVGASFTLTAADLEHLARANAFPAEEAGPTPVLFGLRGAGIVRGDGAGEILLVDQRPDHRSPRCVIGVWDRARGKVSVFQGSTVPEAAAVESYKRTRRAGNLLPTGFYRYIVGAHATARRDGTLNSRPGCFLLRKPDGEKREVVVRRSVDDLGYERADLHERSAPGDNIHPTFSSGTAVFSSFGCQTVVGTADSGGNHKGPWAEFRRAAGQLDVNGDPGKGFVYMLLTGAEARIASEQRRAGAVAAPASLRRLRRLRFGSKSPAVTELQKRLSLSNPDQVFGPGTAEALHGFQRGLSSGGSDGIWTPSADASLRWGVFGEA